MRRPEVPALSHAALAALVAASCSTVGLEREHSAPERELPSATDSRSAKEMYDEYFGQYLPDHEDMGWEDTDWLSVEWVNERRAPSPESSGGPATHHHLLDFNPHNFSRPGWDDDSFPEPQDTTVNRDLIAAGDADAYWKQVDTTAWQPAVASTYSRTATSDRMADQFRLRLRDPESRRKLERALELCPDCDDVFTPLSANDLFKVIEVRFARISEGRFQLSRVFKLIGIDSSGDPVAHSRNEDWNYFGTVDGEDARAKWRMELSGLLTQKYWDTDENGDYIRIMPVLVRASDVAARHQYYDGQFDREVVTDDPYDRFVSPDEEGTCIPDCHAWACNRDLNYEGNVYWRDDHCECFRSDDPEIVAAGFPDDVNVMAAGKCEAFDGDFSPHPSSAADGIGPDPGDGGGLEPDPDPMVPDEPVCGDEVVEGDEECDTGDARSDTEPDACRLDCSDPICGDNVVDDGEVCDTGDDRSNTEPGACRRNCQGTNPVCGDGVVEGDEECDTGDDRSDTEPDACRMDCTEPVCGDSVVDDGEECDTGDELDDDEPNACREDCSNPVCGDEIVDTDFGEECDPGLSSLSDSIPNACRPGCIAATCGDGVRDAGEDCDDGPDGSETCSTSCTVIEPPDEGPEGDEQGGDDMQNPPDADPGEDQVSAGGCSEGTGSASPLALMLLLALAALRRRVKPNVH